MQQADSFDACDVCTERCSIEEARICWDTVTCSLHFIDAVFPEEEEERKPPTPPDPRRMQYSYPESDTRVWQDTAEVVSRT